MPRVGLATQLARLDRALDALGFDGTRAAARHHLATLAPGDRDAFLAIFEPAEVHGADSLLVDIDAFLGELPDAIAELTGRRWTRRRDWDDDDWESEPTPVRDDIDSLYRRLGERFLAGDLQAAIAGYRRLLQAAVDAADNDDYNGYSVAGSDDVQREALARLVNAILTDEADAFQERAAATVEAITSFQTTVVVPTLAEIVGAATDSIADRRDLLRALLVACEATARVPSAWPERAVHRLTVELVVHLDGIDALARLATDSSYPHRQHASRAWLDGLEGAGRADDALAATIGTLAAMERSYDRAEFADRLARLYRARHNAPAAAAADLRAFADHPTIGRLAWLCQDTHEPLDSLSDDLDDAVKHANATIVTAIDILTGRLERLGHTDGGTRTDTIDGFEPAVGALLLASRPPVDDLGARLCRSLLASIDRQRRDHLDALRRAGRRDPEPPALAPYLAAAALRCDLAPQHADTARVLVDRAAAVVLGSKQRAWYEKVARLVVALAHTHEAIGGERAAETIAGYAQTYSRFSAFRSELTKAAKAAR